MCTWYAETDIIKTIKLWVILYLNLYLPVKIFDYSQNKPGIIPGVARFDTFCNNYLYEILKYYKMLFGILMKKLIYKTI